eukprot:TRINITY_DN17046_c0_g1_i1.p1 TRINITY_DN17046_c0_g1~~TRINITY_DN17046_c0_g1_i1.p1  ORF type:complete len:391 (-),score=51.35 TRINITY_DN17046_c0_g1_i1:46-1218(-)
MEGPLNGSIFAPPPSVTVPPLSVDPPHINGTMLWQDIVFISSGLFSGASVFCSLLLIWFHLRNWTVPEHQTHIVRILIMVPIYSVDSWLSLRFRDYSLYFDIARDCYEAYVLHQFFSLLLAYIEVGNGPNYIERVLEEQPKQKHPIPCCCLPMFKPGPLFLLITKQCILQYVLIRPLMAIAASILQATGVYEEGHFQPTHGYLWVTLIVNTSVTISMYFLVLFYFVLEKQLKPFSPVAKLTSVKAVLFFSFWQTVIIGTLSYFHVLPSVGDWEAEEVATGLNNWIICMEMFIFSIVHHFVFPYQSYKASEQAKRTLKETLVGPVINFKSVVDQKDLFTDIKSAYSPKNMKNARLYQEHLRLLDHVQEGSGSDQEENFDSVSFDTGHHDSA